MQNNMYVYNKNIDVYVIKFRLHNLVIFITSFICLHKFNNIQQKGR